MLQQVYYSQDCAGIINSSVLRLHLHKHLLFLCILKDMIELEQAWGSQVLRMLLYTTLYTIVHLVGYTNFAQKSKNKIPARKHKNKLKVACPALLLNDLN